VAQFHGCPTFDHFAKQLCLKKNGNKGGFNVLYMPPLQYSRRHLYKLASTSNSPWMPSFGKWQILNIHYEVWSKNACHSCETRSKLDQIQIQILRE
jgi:hypothetical protein